MRHCCMWVELWPVLYAIVNFIATSRDWRICPPTPTAWRASPWPTSRRIASRLVWGQAMAGLLALSVPFIALAIVMGGAYTASGVVSQLMAPASGAAQSAGAQAGLGNASMGNLAWSNVSNGNMNSQQWNTTYRHESGRAAAVTNTPYGSLSDRRPRRRHDRHERQPLRRWAATSAAARAWGAPTPIRSDSGVRASAGAQREPRYFVGRNLVRAQQRGVFAADSRQRPADRLGQSGRWGQDWMAGSAASAQTSVDGESSLKNRESQRTLAT